MYKIRAGETIRDVCMNACGSITAWEDILNLNEFTEWVPELVTNQEIDVPYIVDVPNQSLIQKYPSNNDCGINIDILLTNFVNILETAPQNDFVISNITQPFINYYTIRAGETIKDVCLNATGTIDNWEDILNANNFTEWVPDLFTDQKIIISSDVEIQTNVLIITNKYPSNNDVGINNFEMLVNDFISNFGNILTFRADSLKATADSTILTADINK